MAKRKRKRRKTSPSSNRAEDQQQEPLLDQYGTPYGGVGPLRIRLYGDEILREKALPIEQITDVERKLAEDMLVTMYVLPNGIGLAAPQVGVLKRLIVIDLNRDDLSSKPLVLINPEIQMLEGELTEEEGCLSIPDVAADVKRAEKAVVTALNLDGDEIEVKGENFLARALQHEIDHLNGILFIDHVSGLKCPLLRAKLRKLSQELQKSV